MPPLAGLALHARPPDASVGLPSPKPRKKKKKKSRETKLSAQKKKKKGDDLYRPLFLSNRIRFFVLRRLGIRIRVI